MRRVVIALSIAIAAPEAARALSSNTDVEFYPNQPPTNSKSVSDSSNTQNAGLKPATRATSPSAKSSSSSNFQSNSAAKLGLAYLNSKQYSKASESLKLAIQADPHNAHLYYYYANALVHLSEHHDAIAAYRRSYEIDPYSTVSGFCRQALLGYNVAVPVADPKQQGSHFTNASETIRRQAAEEKARKKKHADHLSGKVLDSGLAKANRIKAEAEAEIKQMYENPILYDSNGEPRAYGLPYWRLPPVQQDALKARAEQIRRDAAERAQFEINQSSDKSSEYKKWLKEREGDLDNVSESLETQLRVKGSRSGVSLNPVGTGLYVRNYSTLKPKNPLPEPRPSVVRMLDRGHNDSEPERTERDRVSTD